MNRPAWEALPAALRELIQSAAPADDLWEIRLRVGQKIQLVGRGMNRLCGDEIPQQRLAQIVSALMEHSLYAWEDELARGYFTTRQGFRVGVAGKYRCVDGRLILQDVYSLCIRLAREVRGCADPLVPLMMRGYSCLILSSPGCGKTTLLRDAARQLSNRGRNVAVLDERCEIAAAWMGQPGMDVGERTDVAEGVDKPCGIPMIVRAMSPQVLVTDELGGVSDADAVLDAIRCGVQVLASAHAASLTDAQRRTSLIPLLENGLGMIAVLTHPPGTLQALYVRESDGWRKTPVQGGVS